MGEMLSVKNINVYYGSIHAIKDVSFHVNEGEIVTLIGANGAGKTTTMHAISGLLKVVQGSGTVAVTTAATLCAPIAASLGLDPILIFLASGAGARLCCHVNDSYFWVYTNCMGFDMKTGLKTLSISNLSMSLGGLLATFICSLWL